MKVFDTDAALAALTDDPLAADFVARNAERLGSLAAAETNAILERFLAGDGEGALLAFYADRDWPTIKTGLDQLVTDTAGVADRAARQRQWFVDAAAMAAGLLLKALAAGCCP